jgi:3-phenylpropionate/cinnamic acid dioxygenase small subunit
MALTIEQALDRIEISDVLVQYAVHMDAGDFDSLAAIFSEDAGYDIAPDPGIVPVPARGRAAIRKILSDRYAEVSQTAQRRHLITNIAFDRLEGDAADTRCFLTILSIPKAGGPVELRGTGVYFDKLSRIAGRWQIADRRLVVDVLAPS